MKKKIIILNLMTFLGITMIVVGLTMKIIECENKIKKQEIEINRLLDENDSLWDNYYMNVTNQDGYEYYE